MSSWEAVLRCLALFGGGCLILSGSLALFVWLLYKLDEMDKEG